MVEIFAVELLEKQEFLNKKEFYFACLPDYLLEKYSKYSHNDNLQRSLFGELLVRYYMYEKYKINSKDLLINQAEKGKPFIKDFSEKFNISHSGRWVVAAFSEKNVGIDIEIIREPNYNVSYRFFSKVEIDQLENENDNIKKRNLFFDFWTIKESYLKFIGTGLTRPLSSFTVLFKDNNIKLIDNELDLKVYLKQFSFKENYKLSVCSFDNEFNDSISIIKF